jgi:hypothetical protein
VSQKYKKKNKKEEKTFLLISFLKLFFLSLCKQR